jgi:4-amino-4-deoxy-L-arabinose transferase-like glycosyltransferase
MEREQTAEYRGPLLILLLGVLLLIAPIPFERLHDDEALKFDLMRNFVYGGTLPWYDHLPLPFFVVAPFFRAYGHPFTGRLVTAAFSIGSALLIFWIARKVFDDRAGYAGSLLFLFSFHTLKFGSRFYSDPYGAFFFLLTVYFLASRKAGAAGFSAGFSILGRDLWIPLYPFYLIYLKRKNQSIGRFVSGSILPFLPFVLLLSLTYDIGDFAKQSVVLATAENLYGSLVYGKLGVLLTQMLRGWFEFTMVQILVLMGAFALLLRRKSEDLGVLVLPQFLIVSIVPGFLSNGGLTQYLIGLQASLAMLGGAGWGMLWDRHARPRLKIHRDLFLPVLLLVLAAQFLAFQFLATSISRTGMVGVYDLGYRYDREIIDLLNREARGEVIVGIHGAFVEGAAEWIWVERNVTKGLEIEPDWFITEKHWIRRKAGYGKVPEVEAYSIGPYVVLHSHPRGHMKEAVEAVPVWKGRLIDYL